MSVALYFLSMCCIACPCVRCIVCPVCVVLSALCVCCIVCFESVVCVCPCVWCIVCPCGCVVLSVALSALRLLYCLPFVCCTIGLVFFVGFSLVRVLVRAHECVRRQFLLV